MGLYDAEPEGEARAAVIVAQEAFGVNPHIEDVTRRLAAAGYRAVAPHLFHRTGDPVIEYGDYDKIMPQFAGLSEAGVLNDIDAAIAYLRAGGLRPGPHRCGRASAWAGPWPSWPRCAAPLGAGVTFYGGGITEGRFGMASMVELAPELQAPWLGLYGDEDQGIPVEQVEALRAAAAAAKVDTEIVRYPGAGHGFHCDMRGDYHERRGRRRLEAHPGLVRASTSRRADRSGQRAGRRRGRAEVARKRSGRALGEARTPL